MERTKGKTISDEVGFVSVVEGDLSEGWKH